MAFRVVVPISITQLQDEEKCQEIGAELFVIPCRTEDELIVATQDADAILTDSDSVPFTRKVISTFNECKLIHNMGAGYEGIDVQAATDYGICVSNGGDFNSEEVAEHAMALILACARKLVRLDRAVRAGKWSHRTRMELWEMLPPMFQIRGQTLGIIGFGNIGRRIVPKAKGFELRVIAFDPYVPSDVFKKSGVESVTLDTLLRESDFVTVHAALTKESRHLLGIEEFRKMKPTAYFINCARGDIVNQEALCSALANGYIAGSGLDVVAKRGVEREEYVSLDDPLLKLENVILTPHYAFYSEHSPPEMKRRAYEHLGQVFRGQWPTWFINPEVKEKFLERWRKA
jgi:D-3-phosphoglycerate dehydrogenase